MGHISWFHAFKIKGVWEFWDGDWGQCDKFMNSSWTSHLHKLNNANGWWKWGQLWVTNITWIHYIYMVQTWEEAITFFLILYFVLFYMDFIRDHLILASWVFVVGIWILTFLLNITHSFKWIMEVHFQYLHFKTFPILWIKK